MTSSSTDSFQKFQIDNFKEYVDFIADMSDHFPQELCLFRGQLCDKPLIPKIGRLEISEISVFEKKLFEDFKKRYIAYSPKLYSNDWDLLRVRSTF